MSKAEDIAREILEDNDWLLPTVFGMFYSRKVLEKTFKDLEGYVNGDALTRGVNIIQQNDVALSNILELLCFGHLDLAKYDGDRRSQEDLMNQVTELLTNELTVKFKESLYDNL